jgi:glycosyltransferase involved in cell wall biosynthesis
VDDNEFEQVELIQIIEEYKNLHLIRGRNRGVAAARNLGLSAGNNALVSFIDSDDYLLPGYLEIQRNFHIKNPSIAATGTWLQGFGSVSTVYPQWDGINPLGLVMCLPPAGVLIWKRSILEINRFDLSFGKGFEDFDLVARVIATNYSIAVFDFPLYMYQRGHISLSQSWSPKTEQELRSKVNSNVTLLCRHKAALLFDLLSIYGKRLLVSHPDMVFRTNFRTRKPLSSLDLIVKIRKSNSIRNIWRRLPEPIRFKLFTFIVRS